MRFIAAFLAMAAIPLGIASSACSSKSAGNPFPNVPDAGSPPAPDTGTFAPEPEAGASDAAPAVCPPASATSFTPVWQTPEKWKQAVCTSTQIADFYTACLNPPVVASACTAFVQGNASCVPCLQSQDTDPTSAAIIWHDKNQYWTTNVAGCIADADATDAGSSSAGCATAYSAAISCRETVCNACLDGPDGGETQATFDAFSSCQTTAGSTTCQTYVSAFETQCANIDSTPASVCETGSAATLEDAYTQIAALFCGL